MNSCLPLLPVHVVDFVGASLMILFSLVAFYYAWKLTVLEPKSVLWSYLFWLCMAMVAFALSRGIGHVLKFVFIFMGFPHFWDFFAPYSGGLNTITFISITTLTFYFPAVRRVIGRVKDDAKRLKQTSYELAMANKALVELNQNLEQRVEERTRELQLSEQKFRRLFENSKDIIFFCDCNGKILDINDSGLELLGFSEKKGLAHQEIRGLFVNENDWQRFQGNLKEAGHVKDLEVEFKCEDGSHISMLITSDLIRDENGAVVGCEGIAKDLTRYKQVMANLVHSEKMASLGRMAADVAHEINTPLGIILGYTQLLKEDLSERKDLMESLELIEKQTKICKKIVADLLNFSRESLHKTKEPVNITQCLEEVMAIVEHSLKMDMIYVHKVYAPDLPPVLADKEKLRQVFVNIINNAHDAIHKEGLVGVWTRYNPATQMVEVIIGDTGPGIPPDILTKIFDPFFTTKEVGKGTGLGLSVSFGIVQECGGTISVESPPRDEALVEAGMETVFIIKLPSYTQKEE
jgi:two-component system NtrC family sensor kinase